MISGGKGISSTITSEPTTQTHSTQKGFTNQEEEKKKEQKVNQEMLTSNSESRKLECIGNLGFCESTTLSSNIYKVILQLYISCDMLAIPSLFPLLIQSTIQPLWVVGKVLGCYNFI